MRCGFDVWEGADVVEDFTDRLPVERIWLGRLCFLEVGSSRPAEPDSGRFWGTKADEGVVVAMEGWNLVRASDPRSATSCGFVHFE